MVRKEANQWIYNDIYGHDAEKPGCALSIAAVEEPRFDQAQLEDAGAPAIVMYSLFEEQIIAGKPDAGSLSRLRHGSFAEALSYYPEKEDYKVGPDEYLELIEGQRGRGYSHHRQPERRLHRRLDRVCALYRGSRRRRAGTERLLFSHRSLYGWRDIEQMYLDVLQAVCRKRHHPGGGETEPLL